MGRDWRDVFGYDGREWSEIQEEKVIDIGNKWKEYTTIDMARLFFWVCIVFLYSGA